MWCDAYAPHLESAKSRLNPESHWLVNGSFLLTESFCKNYLFSATSLWCTLVNPFVVVHPTHILVHPRVPVYWLKSADLGHRQPFPFVKSACTVCTVCTVSHVWSGAPCTPVEQRCANVQPSEWFRIGYRSP